MRSRVFQLSAHIIIHMKTVGTIWLALSIYQVDISMVNIYFLT